MDRCLAYSNKRMQNFSSFGRVVFELCFKNYYALKSKENVKKPNLTSKCTDDTLDIINFDQMKESKHFRTSFTLSCLKIYFVLFFIVKVMK